VSKVACKESFFTLIFYRSLLCFSMMLILCLANSSFINTSLFSCFLTCNFALNFCSFSKTPYILWIDLSFSSIIYLFLISILKNMSRMLVICVLYFVACWNILVALLCSSKSSSNPYVNLGVWNLGVYHLELLYELWRT
jgi:hypothetical protein